MLVSGCRIEEAEIFSSQARVLHHFEARDGRLMSRIMRCHLWRAEMNDFDILLHCSYLLSCDI